jgi:hypothetical protein
MSIITKMRKQTCVLFKRSKTPDVYGRYIYESGVELICRWENKLSEYVDAEGTRQVAQSVIYPAQLPAMSDFLYEGTLEDLQTLSSGGQSLDLTCPETIPGIVRVCAIEKIPNLKNSETLYIAYANP